VRDVMQCDEDRHGTGYSSSFFEQNTAESPDQALTTGSRCPDVRRITVFYLVHPVNPWLI